MVSFITVIFGWWLKSVRRQWLLAPCAVTAGEITSVVGTERERWTEERRETWFILDLSLHRINQVGKDWVQSITKHPLVNQTTELGTIQEQGLYHLSGQPTPMSNHSFWKKFFLMFSLNFPWCSLGLFPLVLSLAVWDKRLPPTWLQPPFREL